MKSVRLSLIVSVVTARGRVLKVCDTGVSIDDNPQVGLLLEVSPASGSPFQAETKTVVSRLNVALVQPGARAEVKYEPQKPQRLQVLNLDVSGGASGRAAYLSGMYIEPMDMLFAFLVPAAIAGAGLVWLLRRG